MKSYLAFAAIVAATFAPAAQATGCRVVVRKQAVVVNKVIVEKVAAIAVPVVAVAAVPYYASYYQPAPVAPAVQGNAAGVADNSELTNAIKILVERIDRLEKAIQAPPMQPADPVKPPPMPKPGDPFNPQGAAPIRGNGAAFAASCVQCHQPGGTGTKGLQGIVLFDAQRNILPGVEGRMLSSVYAGRMPKDNPLDDKATGEFMSGMDAHLKSRAGTSR